MFWLKAAVDSEHASIVSGKLPDEIEGEPRTTFVTAPRKSDTARLADAVEKQTEVMSKLLVELAGKKR